MFTLPIWPGPDRRSREINSVSLYTATPLPCREFMPAVKAMMGNRYWIWHGTLDSKSSRARPASSLFWRSACWPPFAVQFRLTADIERWQPSQGEFATTHIRFAQVLPGSTRLLVALERPSGDIWNFSQPIKN